MRRSPEFVKAYGKYMFYDFLCIILFPFVPHLMVFFAMWLLIGSPLAFSLKLHEAMDWLSQKTRTTMGGAAIRAQCAGGLVFLIWATVLHCTAGPAEDKEFHEILLFVVALLQVARLGWFAYLNVATMVLIPFRQSRHEKLCLLAAGLTALGGLWLWSRHFPLPRIPQSMEDLTLFVILAISGIGYGLAQGGLLLWAVSSFQPPDESLEAESEEAMIFSPS